MNTAEYNLKKLLDSELIEKTKNFFWSSKGKKIPMYRLSNKSIIISPKKRLSSQVRTILPVAIISGIGALIVRQLTLLDNLRTKTSTEMLQAAAPAASGLSSQSQASLWFFVGACFAIIIFVLLSLRKIDKSERR